MCQTISDIENMKFDDVCEEPQYPLIFRNDRGDCLEFILKSGEFRRVRVDDLITLFCSRATDEIIGGVVKGISSLETRHPGILFLLENHSGKVCLSRLLLVIVSDSEKLRSAGPDDWYLKHYKRLLDLADEMKVLADLCPGDLAR